MGLYQEDGDDDELSSFLTSSAPMSDEQKAKLMDKVGLGAKIQDDESYKKAQDEAKSSNFKTSLLEGLSTAFAGPQKTDSAFYNGLRKQAQDRVKGTEDAFKDRQRVAQYIIGRDDKLRGLQAQKQAGEWKKSDKPDADGYEILTNAQGEVKRGARVVAKAEPRGPQGSFDQLVDKETGAVTYYNPTTGQTRAAPAGLQPKSSQVVDKSSDEANYRYTALRQNADKLKQLVKKNGTFDLFGAEGDNMDKTIYEMAIDYAKMVDPDSVAREGEVAAAQKYMLPFRNMGGMTTSNKTAEAQIDQYLSDLDARLQARLATKGGKMPAAASKDKGASGDFGGGTAVAAPKPAFKDGDTKVINGKTYVRQNGGWTPQ